MVDHDDATREALDRLIEYVQVRILLEGYRFHAPDEDTLQCGIAAVLQVEGIPFAREVDLGAAGRADFAVGGGAVLIEAKVGGSLMDLARQVQRYCECDGVEGIIVVTTRQGHRALPETLAGTPIAVVWTGGAL